MNKICVITGGGSGMGRATARIMAVQGYYVVLVGRTAAKLEDTVRELTAAGGNAESVSCDITDKLGTKRSHATPPVSEKSKSSFTLRDFLPTWEARKK